MANINLKGKKQRSKNLKDTYDIEDITEKFKYNNFAETIKDGI